MLNNNIKAKDNINTYHSVLFKKHVCLIILVFTNQKDQHIDLASAFVVISLLITPNAQCS